MCTCHAYITSRILKLLFVVTLALHLAIFARAETTITARVNNADDNAYTFVENGEWQGITIDFYRALIEGSSYKINYKSVPWSRVFQELKNGRTHIIPFLTPTDERKKNLYLIGPHSNEKMVVFVNQKFKNEKLSNIDDMIILAKKTGLKFGLQNNYFVSKEFHQQLENNHELRDAIYRHPDTGSPLKMVSRGRLLGLIETRFELNYKVKKFPELYSNVIDSGLVLSRKDVYFGVSKSLPESVVDRLRKTNKRLTDDGTYTKFNIKWHY